MNADCVIRLVEKHAQYCEFASQYGEPGYTDPESGILFANWNNVPPHIIKGLERRGFDLEWSDEWTTANDGLAYRTSPDSYGWTPSYIIHEGEVIGKQEILSDPEWYVEEYLKNVPDHCEVMGVDVTDFGFTLHEQGLETGFHPGQNDDPRKVYETLCERFDVVFVLDGKGQFDVSWSVYVRPIAGIL